MWQRTFLYRVLQKDKLLFACFALFILCQLFFTFKGVENTPFFHYGMYSAPHRAQATYPVYRISINKAPVRSGDFFDAQREVVYNTIATYDGLKQLGFRDSLDKVISHRFPGTTADKFRKSLLNDAKMDTPYQKWLFSYMADMRMIEGPELEVTRSGVSYQPDGTLRADSAHLIFRLKDE